MMTRAELQRMFIMSRAEFIKRFNELVKPEYELFPYEDRRVQMLYSDYIECVSNNTTFELATRHTKSGRIEHIE